MSNTGNRGVQLPGIRELFPELLPQSSQSQSSTNSQSNRENNRHLPQTANSSSSVFSAGHSRSQSVPSTRLHSVRDGQNIEPITGSSHPFAPQGHLSTEFPMADPTGHGDRAQDVPTLAPTRQGEWVAPPRNQEERRYMCPVCKKLFSRPSAVDAHMTSHTGERPYACTYPGCNKSFTTKSNMRRHCQSHTASNTDRVPASHSQYYGQLDFRGRP